MLLPRSHAGRMFKHSVAAEAIELCILRQISTRNRVPPKLFVGARSSVNDYGCYDCTTCPRNTSSIYVMMSTPLAWTSPSQAAWFRRHASCFPSPAVCTPRKQPNLKSRSLRARTDIRQGKRQRCERASACTCVLQEPHHCITVHGLQKLCTSQTRTPTVCRTPPTYL